MWNASEHSLPVTCLHAAKGGGRVYSCSSDRTAKAWDACSGRLLLSVACPVFLQTVTTDPAETFLFAAGRGGVIFQVLCWRGSYRWVGRWVDVRARVRCLMVFCVGVGVDVGVCWGRGGLGFVLKYFCFVALL